MSGHVQVRWAAGLSGCGPAEDMEVDWLTTGGLAGWRRVNPPLGRVSTPSSLLGGRGRGWGKANRFALRRKMVGFEKRVGSKGKACHYSFPSLGGVLSFLFFVFSTPLSLVFIDDPHLVARRHIHTNVLSRLDLDTKRALTTFTLPNPAQSVTTSLASTLSSRPTSLGACTWCVRRPRWRVG
jgi:hypothetical protein